MAISLFFTHCLAFLCLVFFHGSDIAMMSSSTQTQLYIKWILFLPFVFLLSPLPIWILQALWQSDMAGLSPDGHDSVQTLKAVSPSLPEAENRLNPVPGFKPLSCISGAKLMPSAGGIPQSNRLELELELWNWYLVCPVLLSNCYVSLYPTEGISVFICFTFCSFKGTWQMQVKKNLCVCTQAYRVCLRV